MAIRVKRSAALSLVRGHPWVYRDAMLRAPSGLATGAPVEVLSEEGDFLGRGLYEADSPIAVRVYGSTKGPAIDAAALAEGILRAIARRDGMFGPGTDAYRLCNGEGDRVPGFVMDRYGSVAVVRLDTEGLRAYLGHVLSRLEGHLKERGIVIVGLRRQSEGPRAGVDGRDDRTPKDGKKLDLVLGDSLPDKTVIHEHGVAMEVDLVRGQKTGAFLDQRENRRRVRALARGRVLNLFSYAGGFSVAAALGGAEQVTSVDIAPAAHATAQRTFVANRIDPSGHLFVTGDVFAFLESARQRGERYDLVISDPPSFAPSERARPRALTAYRKLHGAIGHVLASGAVLCAASCSSHVPAEDFVATLDDAALGRSGLVLRDLYGQPADHPTLPAWPEGRYLKFAILG